MTRRSKDDDKAPDQVDNEYRVVSVTSTPNPEAIATAVRAFLALRLLRRERDARAGADD